jgi:hypothetical protein
MPLARAAFADAEDARVAGGERRIDDDAAALADREAGVARQLVARAGCRRRR